MSIRSKRRNISKVLSLEAKVALVENLERNANEENQSMRSRNSQRVLDQYNASGIEPYDGISLIDAIKNAKEMLGLQTISESRHAVYTLAVIQLREAWGLEQPEG